MPRVLNKAVANIGVYVNGKEVVFNAVGVAEVDDAIAAFLAEIPGYEVQLGQKTETEAIKDVATETEVVKDAEEEEVEGEIAEPKSVEEFNALHWTQQRQLVNQGKISAEGLQMIVEGEYAKRVRQAAVIKLQEMEG